MTVERISSRALKVLLSDHIKQESTCVVKFYSNTCHLCHGLKNYYEELSHEFEDVLFFAFNTDDYDNLDSIIAINGTPSICLVNTGPRRNIVVLADPQKPDEITWFTRPYIRDFIEREKR